MSRITECGLLVQLVYSSKTLKGVDDGRVTFKDGSWYDSSTRQVHNAGPGYISVGFVNPRWHCSEIMMGPTWGSVFVVMGDGSVASGEGCVDVRRGTITPVGIVVGGADGLLAECAQ